MSASTSIALAHNSNGGCTFNLQRGPITSGFALSVFPEYTRKLPGANIEPGDVDQFIDEHADVLSSAYACVGTWFNEADGETYLDVSCVTANKEAAIAAAIAANQIAIFDLSTFAEIATGGTGTAGALPSGSARLQYLFGHA